MVAAGRRLGITICMLLRATRRWFFVARIPRFGGALLPAEVTPVTLQSAEADPPRCGPGARYSVTAAPRRVLRILCVLCGFSAGAAVPTALPRAWLWRMETWPARPGPLRQAPAPSGQRIQRDFTRVLKNMQRSAKNLNQGRSGQSTRRAQQRVITALDDLIKQAETMSASSSSSPSSSSLSAGMKLRLSQGQSGHGRHGPGGGAPAGRDYIPGGSSLPVQRGRPFLPQRQAWGNLPPRTRNLILNALHYQSLPQWRRQVNAYYRALGRMNRQDDR